MRSGTDVGRFGGSQSAFQFIPKVFDGVEVRVLCRPVKFFHTDLDKPFLYEPRFMHGGIVMLKQKRAFPKLLHKVGSTESSRMSLYAVALRFPFAGTWGPHQNHEKQPQTIIPPTPNVQLALCILAGSVLLASAKPRFICRTARW